MPTVHTTTFTTYADGDSLYKGTSLEDAIRTWDALTFSIGRPVAGGISVQSFDRAGIMVRDGWMLHVREDGTVYLHPRIAEV